MIRFTVYGDRFICEDEQDHLFFEIYPADEDNQEKLSILITALTDLRNDRHVEDTVVDFEEA